MNQRCHYILNVLRSSEAPVTASALAQQLSGKLDRCRADYPYR